MTAFYDALATTATALLTRFGQAGFVRRVTITGGGPSDPSGGATTTEDTAAQVAVFPISDDRIDGTNIVATDFQVIVQPLAFEITTDDLIVCTEGTLTIKHLGKIAPEGTVVAYDMVCSL